MSVDMTIVPGFVNDVVLKCQAGNQTTMKKPIVGVMGSGNTGWEEWAGPLGRWIGEAGYHLLTGGGPGVMAAVSKAFYETEGRAGLCIGVLPVAGREFALKPGYPNPWVELPINSAMTSHVPSDPNGVNRNFVNVLTSNVIVALPGRHGTRNEVDLALRFHKPIILFGPADAFGEFPEEVERTESIGRVREFVREALVNSS